MKHIRALAVFAGVLAVAGAVFFLAPRYGEGNLDEDVTEEPTAPVEVTVTQPGVIQTYLRLNGDVRATSTIDVLPDVSGKLVRISASPGQYVQRDQVLGSVDSSRPGASFAESPIRAPVSGTVTRVIGEIGASVAPAVPVFQISQLQSLEIIAQVPERNVWDVKIGQTVYIRSSAASGRVIRGRVAEISPVVDSRSRSMEVTISLSGGASLVKAGMFTDLTIVTGSHEGMAIPVEALIEREGIRGVFVAGDDGTALLVSVETGVEADGYVLITGGLAAGSRIILSGQELISSGTPVDVVATRDGLSVKGNLSGLIEAVE